MSEENIDPGELIRGLTDGRRRLGQIKKDKEGRGRLVEMITSEGAEGKGEVGGEGEGESGGKEKPKKGEKEEVRSVVEIDKRVGELEKLVGAATTVLDEVRGWGLGEDGWMLMHSARRRRCRLLCCPCSVGCTHS